MKKNELEEKGSKPPTDERAKQLAKRFDKTALDDLEQMIQWWRHGAEIEPEREQRPMFAGKRRNTGVHVNEEILERAMTKLKGDKFRTGGSLSQLVELLLWEYIGKPADVLEPVSPGTAQHSSIDNDSA